LGEEREERTLFLSSLRTPISRRGPLRSLLLLREKREGKLLHYDSPPLPLKERKGKFSQGDHRKEGEGREKVCVFINHLSFFTISRGEPSLSAKGKRNLLFRIARRLSAEPIFRGAGSSKGKRKHFTYC